MADAFAVQAKIRQNAEEMQDYMKELQRWEKKMGKRDKELRRARRGAGGRSGGGSAASAASAAPPVRASGGVVPVRGAARARGPVTETKTGPKTETKTETDPAAHVYDRGYKRWEDFDVDAALAEAEAEADDPPPVPPTTTTPEEVATPATLGRTQPRRAVRSVPRPRPAPASDKPRDVVERELGNEQFRRGEFEAAIKSYTRSLGINPRSAAAYSNRAACLLKGHKYLQAQADCTLALRVDPEHAKSLFRRAAARNGLGRHRAALADLEAALALDPAKRQLRVELRKTRELVKSAVRKTPRRRVDVAVVTGRAPFSPQPRPAVTPATLADAFPQREPAPQSPPRAQTTVVVRSSPASSPAASPASSPAGRRSPTRSSPAAAAARRQAVAAPAVASAGGAKPKRKRPKLPKSAFELEQTWRALDRAERAAFLPRIKARTAAKIFRSAIEPTLFTSMLETAAEDLEPAAAQQALAAIGAAPGLATTLMFCRDTERALIARVLEGAGAEVRGVWGV